MDKIRTIIGYYTETLADPSIEKLSIIKFYYDNYLWIFSATLRLIVDIITVISVVSVTLLTSKTINKTFCGCDPGLIMV